MGSLLLPDLKQQFIDMLDKTRLPIISQFMVWLDEKVSEFKVNGYMKLDNGPDCVPRWIEEYTSLHDSLIECNSTANVESKADITTDAETITSTPTGQSPPHQHQTNTLTYVKTSSNIPTHVTSPVKTSSDITNIASPVKTSSDITNITSPVKTSLGITNITSPVKTSSDITTPVKTSANILTHVTSPIKTKANIVKTPVKTLSSILPNITTPVKQFAAQSIFPGSLCARENNRPAMKLRIEKVDSDTFDSGTVSRHQSDDKVTDTVVDNKEQFNDISVIEQEVMKSDLSNATPLHTIEVCIDENGEYYIVNTEGKVSEEAMIEGTIHYNDDGNSDSNVVMEQDASCDATVSVPDEKIYPSGRRREWVPRVRKAPKEYGCSYCNKKFATPYKVRRHEGIHTGQKPFECVVCHKTFIVEGYMHEHMKLHSDQRPHQCQYCDKTFKIKGQLTTHTRVVHEGLKPFACSFCDHRCYSSTMLREHINTHTRDQPHKCDICGKTFSFKTNLSKHLKNHQGIRPHQCPDCGKSFTDKCLLSKHQERVHSDNATQKRLALMSSCDRPHRCLLCGMGFKVKYGLTKHMQIHSSTRPFKCDYCPRAFRRNYDLSLHMNVHTNANKYMCSVCGKCYTQSQSLRAHVRAAHRDSTHEEHDDAGSGEKLEIITDNDSQPLEN